MLTQGEVYKLADNKSAYNANEYDEKIKKTIPYYEDIYRQILDIAENYEQKSIKWLDVGCGTGKLAEILHCKSYIEQLVLCDTSKEMLNIAKQNYRDGNVQFEQQDVRSLEYKNQFDVVTAVMVNHYLQPSQRKQSIKNCYNALKNGGIFITFENFAPNSEKGKDMFLNRWSSWQLHQGKSCEECNNHKDRYNKSYFPITVAEHIKLIHECGFESVELLWLSYMQVGILGIK